MKVTKTAFEGLWILEPKVFNDARGYFYESYSKRTCHEIGLDVEFVQSNQSLSKKNVIRGLHFQNAPHTQVRLIRVLQGRILDVVLDLRRDQGTFGKIFSIELAAEEKKQLFIPKGFAHGFSVLSDKAEFLYSCDAYYYPASEGGIHYNDPALGINWKLDSDQAIVSEKDLSLPLFSATSFVF